MHKKAYELIWLHFFCFFWFLSFFSFGPPLETMEKKVVEKSWNFVRFQKILNPAFAENFKKIGWKSKKAQSNELIGLFVYFPFEIFNGILWILRNLSASDSGDVDKPSYSCTMWYPSPT